MTIRRGRRGRISKACPAGMVGRVCICEDGREGVGGRCKKKWVSQRWDEFLLHLKRKKCSGESCRFFGLSLSPHPTFPSDRPDDKPCSPAAHTLIALPHSELRTWWAEMRREALGSRML